MVSNVFGDVGGAYDDASATVFDYHHSMLVDRVRTESFLKAILASVSPGDVVADLGAGTGVLSLFAVKAGASKVYAIEEGLVADLARQVVRANGLDDRIEFIEANSTQAGLPEPADVIVTETIGNAGFEEGILAWVADAKERFLKPGGLVIPGQLTAEVSLVEVHRDYAEIDRWASPLLGFDFSPLRDVAVNNMLTVDLSPANLLSDTVTMLRTGLLDGRRSLSAVRAIRARRNGTVHGLGVWFEADLRPGLTLTNRPPSVTPSWRQVVLPLHEPIAVRTDEAIEVAVNVGAGGSDWEWRVGDTPWLGTKAKGQLGHLSG